MRGHHSQTPWEKCCLDKCFYNGIGEKWKYWGLRFKTNKKKSWELRVSPSWSRTGALGQVLPAPVKLITAERKGGREPPTHTHSQCPRCRKIRPWTNGNKPSSPLRKRQNLKLLPSHFTRTMNLRDTSVQHTAHSYRSVLMDTWGTEGWELRIVVDQGEMTSSRSDLTAEGSGISSVLLSRGRSHRLLYPGATQPAELPGFAWNCTPSSNCSIKWLQAR